MLIDKKVWFLIAHETIQTTPAQYKRHWPWLAEVDSMALYNVQLDLEKAFRDFFRNPGHFGLPNAP
jgi:putative transposase